MNKTLWINLGIGAGAGCIAYLGGGLSLPLSLATCFVVASAMNMIGLRRS